MASSTVGLLWSGVWHLNLFARLTECNCAGQDNANFLAWCLHTNSVCPAQACVLEEQHGEKRNCVFAQCVHDWKYGLHNSEVENWGAVICDFNSVDSCMPCIACLWGSCFLSFFSCHFFLPLKYIEPSCFTSICMSMAWHNTEPCCINPLTAYITGCSVRVTHIAVECHLICLHLRSNFTSIISWNLLMWQILPNLLQSPFCKACWSIFPIDISVPIS